MFFKKYKPIDYWSKRGKKYQDEFVYNEFFKIQENTLIDYLKAIQFKSVLEYGCRFGRITKLLLENFNIKQYKAFDLSQDQINNAKNYVIIIMLTLKFLQFRIMLMPRSMIL